MFAARNSSAFDLGGEQNPPSVLGHLYVVELRPAVLLDADRGAEKHLGRLESLGTHRLPPVDVTGMPRFEGPAQLWVVGQADGVGDQGVIVDYL